MIIHDRDSGEALDRMIACKDAMTSVPDPAAFMLAVRELERCLSARNGSMASDARIDAALARLAALRATTEAGK